MTSNRYFSPTRHRRARRRGVALLEFALIVLMFLAMLIGMIQYGLYQSTASTLWTMSREGARLAAVQTTGTPNANQEIYKRVLASAAGVDTTDYGTSEAPTTAPLQITINPPKQIDRTSGTEVTITVEYDITKKMIVPEVSEFYPNALKRDGKVVYKTFTKMRVE